MHLPFLDPEELEVMQYGEELVLQVHNKRRNFFLPRFLAYYEAQGGQLEDGWLKVRFIETEETPENPLAGAESEE
jgi:arsenite-transporting ATPase